MMRRAMRESEIGRCRRRLTAGALVLAAGLATGAHAATITVDATVDAVANDGNCTLREAILAANGDTAVDACAAGSGPDVVVVPYNTGPYDLNPWEPAEEDVGLTGDLDITDDLELVGAFARIFITNSLAPAIRVFDVDPAGAGISVHLSGIAVLAPSGCHSWGCSYPGSAPAAEYVANRGSLVIAGCNFWAGAYDTGIVSEGPLRIERSSITAYSDIGISTHGPLEVIDSSIDEGRIGISADGPVTLVRSTVGGNSGEGLRVENATIVNSTIGGNAGYGIVAGGTVELSNATITANANGGVTADRLVLRNSIIGGNYPADCVVTSTIGDAYNIDGDGSCGLSGTDQSAVLLLQAIDMGSPAAPGSGGTACEATDQRGVARPVGTRCDVGALEVTVDTTPTPPSCSPFRRPGCQAAGSRRSKLALEKLSELQHAPEIVVPGSKLKWKWVGSAAVPVSEFGDPTTSAAGYTICLYDQGGRRLRATDGWAGCGSQTSCSWKPTSFGFVLPTGKRASILALKSGESARKTHITYSYDRLCYRFDPSCLGSDASWPLPFETPVRVQLVRNDAPTCWEATFSTSTSNDSFVFKARSDP